MKGGKRENAGAKPKPATRKHPFNCRLPQYLIAWLKVQEASQAVIIEEALVAQHNLESFKNEWSKS